MHLLATRARLAALLLVPLAGTAGAASISVRLAPEVDAKALVVDCLKSSVGRCVVAVQAPGEAQPRVVVVPAQGSQRVEGVPTGSRYCVDVQEQPSWDSCPKKELGPAMTELDQVFFDGK
ncbi:MAG TPA: hypothetical protein VF453_14595 [Burkholderiaceae bacterium]